MKMLGNKYIPVFVGGCFITGVIINSRLTVRYLNKMKNKNLTCIPFISGFFLIPTLIVSSPLILLDTIFDLCIYDKILDKINDNYQIKLKRYHQYNLLDNKYYANSKFILQIEKK